MIRKMLELLLSLGDYSGNISVITGLPESGKTYLAYCIKSVAGTRRDIVILDNYDVVLDSIERKEFLGLKKTATKKNFHCIIILEHASSELIQYADYVFCTYKDPQCFYVNIVKNRATGICDRYNVTHKN